MQFEKNEISIRRAIEQINLYSAAPMIEIKKGWCLSRVSYKEFVDFIKGISMEDYASSCLLYTSTPASAGSPQRWPRCGPPRSGFRGSGRMKEPPRPPPALRRWSCDGTAVGLSLIHISMVW